jgi:hypothetical protein
MEKLYKRIPLAQKLASIRGPLLYRDLLKVHEGGT